MAVQWGDSGGGCVRWVVVGKKENERKRKVFSTKYVVLNDLSSRARAWEEGVRRKQGLCGVEVRGGGGGGWWVVLWGRMGRTWK